MFTFLESEFTIVVTSGVARVVVGVPGVNTNLDKIFFKFIVVFENSLGVIPNNSSLVGDTICAQVWISPSLATPLFITLKTPLERLLLVPVCFELPVSFTCYGNVSDISGIMIGIQTSECNFSSILLVRIPSDKSMID